MLLSNMVLNWSVYPENVNFFYLVDLLMHRQIAQKNDIEDKE